MQIVNVIRFESAVGLELAVPVAFFGLDGKKIIRAVLYGGFYLLGPLLLSPRCRRRRDRQFLSDSDK
jgi:hypothetical protein